MILREVRYRSGPRLLALVICCAFTVGLRTGIAQSTPDLYSFTQPGLSWHTLETEHFRVHFHVDEEGNGSSRTAQVVARIAEEVYGPITNLYQHEPETKVDFILKDFEDYSNGAAYFFDNKIEIWAPALESILRGEHDWLRNVITHEFTHIVQVQKTMKVGRKVPIFYLQYLGYEDVRRPDVLYGYPNVIASYPFASLNNPAWLAEGTAQYMRTGLAYDNWDSHRDMLLRTQVLGGTAMSLPEMGTFFSKNSLERESVYNHGYAFTRYLAKRFGEDILRKISEALSNRAVFDVNRAIKKATGTSGNDLHAEWMEELSRHYRDAQHTIESGMVEGSLLVGDGFSNLHPMFSPDGSQVAYFSNKGYDYSLLGLRLVDLETGITRHFEVGAGSMTQMTHTCAFGEVLVSGVSGGFDWHPDGDKIAYSRILDTSNGSRFSDIFEIDVTSGKKTRLTEGMRAASPVYSPTADSLVFIKQDDGTTNLYIRDAQTAVVEPLTEFTGGIQVSDPNWSGGWIYFSKSELGNRGIYRVRGDGTGLELIIDMASDERSPVVDNTGSNLFFSSDMSGIFNIYRMDLQSRQIEPVTNVVGGAFMPNVSSTGELVFSRYEASGYRIARLENPVPLSDGALTPYAIPEILEKRSGEGIELFEDLRRPDDSDIGKWIPDQNTADTTSTIKPYSSHYTDFSFLPVVRLDNYSRAPSRSIEAQAARRSEVSSLARNAKVGMFVSSREVLEGLSFFGGALVAPGSSSFDDFRDFVSPSRFRKLERDIQLIVDYKKGLRLIPKRWSPQISVEVFHVQRSVENGLSLEEFPCTACYPETTFTDLTYSLWEASLVARSKLSRTLLLEGGYRYSPYQVRTESFFSRELNQTIDGSSQEYYRGRTLFAAAHFSAIIPGRNTDMIPEGIRVHATYEYSPSRLLDRFDIEDGILVPVYQPYKNHRLSLEARYGRKLGFMGRDAHGLSVKLRATSILGGEKDAFFNDYVGGLIGARGYPFYALGGNETGHLQLSYLFPLRTAINKQVGFLTLDKLYARVFADAAVAWSGSWPGFSEIRKDAGAELRLSLGSFYLFPTALFASGTYGFDRFAFDLDEGFQTNDGASFVEYGKELRWHFGLLFDFNL